MAHPRTGTVLALIVVKHVCAEKRLLPRTQQTGSLMAGRVGCTRKPSNLALEKIISPKTKSLISSC